MCRRSFYITTPIYYVNSKPHIGTLYSTLISDFLARHHRLIGNNTFFLTGLDEHGQKVAESAEKAGKNPKEFVDSMVKPFTECWEKFEIKYDRFIRTTDEDHKSSVQKIFKKFIDNGDIYKSTYTEYYCTPCETFVSLEKSENDKCPNCNREVKKISEENYFFRLSKYQDKLLEFYKQNPDFIKPSNRYNEVITFVEGGLKDLSMTRTTVKWGIEFEQDPAHTIYVWGDALTNYISGIGYGNPSLESMFEKYWPADVHVIGKDIIRFHAVYWPAMLMAAGLEIPKHLLVHGFILVNNEKMSKSLGNAIDPFALAETFGIEPVRYFLIKQMNPAHDGSMSYLEIAETINADLANNFGNLISRILSLAVANNVTQISSQPELKDGDCKELFAHADKVLNQFCRQMDNFQTNSALAELMNYSSMLNALIQKKEAWKAAKTNHELFAEVVCVAAHGIYLIAKLLSSIMPQKSAEILSLLTKEDENNLNIQNWRINLSLSKPEQILFTKIDTKQHDAQENSAAEVKPIPAAASSAPDNISFDDFMKVKMAVGQILTCENVAGSDKLFKLSVNFGEERPRQVVSGIAQYYKPEELINRKAIFVINLAPRKIMGLVSEAMILTAKDSETFALLALEKEAVTVGSRIG